MKNGSCLFSLNAKNILVKKARWFLITVGAIVVSIVPFGVRN